MIEEKRTLLISTHIIDSVDMMWDRTIIMQNGKVKANITKDELDASGKTLEELFFDVTEGIDAEDLKETEVLPEEPVVKKRGLFK